MADKLPLDIIHLICEQACVFGNASLRSLALVNHAFHYVALPYVYEHAEIRFSDHASLELAVAEIMATTSRGENYRLYMKRLDIMTLPSRWGMRCFTDYEFWSLPHPDLFQSIRMEDFMPDAVISSDLVHGLRTQHRTPGLNSQKLIPSHYKEENWGPLVELLCVARRLEVLNYAVSNNFPSSLLDALHQYHPTCHLNIWSQENLAPNHTVWRDYHYPKSPELLDPSKVNLFHSPSLRAVIFWHTIGCDNHGDIIFGDGQESVIPLVTMAQNLRYPRINKGREWLRQRSYDFWRASILSYFGEASTALPQLLTVTFDSWDDILDNPFLTKWGQYLPLSQIRTLEVSGFEDISEPCGFFVRLERLERLFITIGDDVAPPNTGKTYYASIFEAINPLKMLRVRRLCNKSTIYSILKHHGQTLETLIIDPVDWWSHKDHSCLDFEPEDIIYFAKMAPRLRELRLRIERSKGDRHEKQLYEALGLFPCLHSLIIDLEYKPRSFNVLWSNDSDIKYSTLYQTALKDILVNAAMDESLALQIWNVISSKKHKENLHNLRHLRLVPFGWHFFSPSSKECQRSVTFQLSRSFLISKREFLGNSSLENHEIGAKERLLEMKKMSLHQVSEERPRLSKSLRRALQSLWGISKSDIEDWTSRWSSFPLVDT